jgi:hypothetical protein
LTPESDFAALGMTATAIARHSRANAIPDAKTERTTD